MRNILYRDIVVDPSEALVPAVRIAPFSLNTDYVNSESDYEFKTDCTQFVSFHVKARYAIVTALEDMNLQPTDVVTILTTSGNYYVSGCVTRAIEAVCRWNREVTDETKAILVIHEFGYAFQNLQELKRYNVPIIEDRAYAFFTEDAEIGSIGDYVIFSLPKAFNMQIGAILCSKRIIEDTVSAQEEEYIKPRLSYGIEHKEEIIEKRMHNYQYLSNALKPIGITPYFEMSERTVPGVFMFGWRDDIDYPHLKEFMQQNGVESSVFYGQHAFFIPVHQNLTKKELDYMINLLWYYHDEYVNKEGNL